MPAVFDPDGAPYSYQHLARLAPEPPEPVLVRGRATLEIQFEFETMAETMDELIEDFIAQHDIPDADTINLEVENNE